MYEHQNKGWCPCYVGVLYVRENFGVSRLGEKGWPASAVLWGGGSVIPSGRLSNDIMFVGCHKVLGVVVS